MLKTSWTDPGVSQFRGVRLRKHVDQKLKYIDHDRSYHATCIQQILTMQIGTMNMVPLMMICGRQTRQCLGK